MAIDIEICSTALVTIGASPISSFTDGSTEATACNTLYEPTVQNELASHPWRFASNEQTISRLSSTPIGKWSAAYQIPADLLSIRAVRSGDRVIPFDRFEDNVFCDAGENETLSIEGKSSDDSLLSNILDEVRTLLSSSVCESSLYLGIE